MMIRRIGVRQRDLPSPFQEVDKRFGVADYRIACEAKRLQRSLGSDLVTVGRTPHRSVSEAICSGIHQRVAQARSIGPAAHRN